jgi:hypothetical protein
MPVVISPDFRSRLTVTATGDLTAVDLGAFLRCERSPDRVYGPVWLDATSATTSMSAADVEHVANLLTWGPGRAGPRGPLAIIATDDRLVGLMRILHGLCERRGINVRVFRGEEDAEQWLAAL